MEGSGEAAPAGMDAGIAASAPEMDIGAATLTALAEVDSSQSIELSDVYDEQGMEWSAADQAAFEGAVVEYRLQQSNGEAAQDLEGLKEFIEDQDSAGPAFSTPDENIESAWYYFSNTSESPESVLESSLFKPFEEDPETLKDGIVISDPFKVEEEDDTPSQSTAIKYMAAELGLAVIDIEVEQDGINQPATLVKAHSLEDLPPMPEKVGEVYTCAGVYLAPDDAYRVMAARYWAEKAERSELPPDFRDKMYDSITYMRKHLQAIAITYEAPEADGVDVSVEPSPIIPAQQYARVSNTPGGDTFLALTNPDESPLPSIRATSKLMKYDVESYQYEGGVAQKSNYRANFK